MTSSNGNILRVTGPSWGNPSVTGGFPSQRPMTRNFDVFFDLRLNKRLSKQSKRQWFETPSRSLLRHCNVDPDGDPSPSEHLFLVLWPGGAMLCHKTWSALVQVMASCLMAPSHYLKQYWLTINMILWFSFHDNVYLNILSIPIHKFYEIYRFEICERISLHFWCAIH